MLISCRLWEDSLEDLRGQYVRAKSQSIDAYANNSLLREQSETILGSIDGLRGLASVSTDGAPSDAPVENELSPLRQR